TLFLRSEPESRGRRERRVRIGRTGRGHFLSSSPAEDYQLRVTARAVAETFGILGSGLEEVQFLIYERPFLAPAIPQKLPQSDNRDGVKSCLATSGNHFSYSP